MAVPKRKTSISKKKMRRSHHKISAANISEDKKSQMKLFGNVVYFLENFETVKLQANPGINHVEFNKLQYKKIEPIINDLKEWILDEHKSDWKSNVYGQCKSWLEILEPSKFKNSFAGTFFGTIKSPCAFNIDGNIMQ